ncbi:hypothetical protein NQ314_011585 [Rhamnusium bicolor]|uniref:Aminotransferase class I/classII large domain-containing protein n=1 Tax=Rhamnusium bicolor TaxID=1586634 RepID=A0AAV8XI64_9CUCU|nr:hypothetical protein NQ314_011585 [Rhamnusium bicolor]
MEQTDVANETEAEDALLEVLNSNNAVLHQYTKSNGHPRFVNVLAKLYSKLLNRDVNPQSEILSTLGASEALFCAITGLIDVGDEVIIIEPYFDVYVPLIKISGGTPRFIALKPKLNESELGSSADWVFDSKELEGLFTEKTRAIILNTPNNPLGKVFDLSELTLIANLCKKMECFLELEHFLASLPGMWERTVTIGSAGKTFCATGWKVGWVYGSAQLLRGLQIVHQYAVFTGSTPLEEAIAIVFEKELSRLGQDESYFVTLEKELKSKRDYIVKKLLEAHMKPTIPDGGFFYYLHSESDEYKDFQFTKWLTKNVGLQGVPPTVFYTDKNKQLFENYVRFCFIKKQETLEKAAQTLNKFNASHIEM